MDAHEASEFRKNHPMFGFLGDDELHVRKTPPSLAATMRTLANAATPDLRAALGEVLKKNLNERYRKAETVDPQPLPKVRHVASGLEVELLDRHQLGPWASWLCRFPDGTTRMCVADEFSSAPGSTTMSPAKGARFGLNKNASRRFQAGDRVMDSDGAIGKVRIDTRENSSTSVVDFVTQAGSRIAIVKNSELTAI